MKLARRRRTGLGNPNVADGVAPALMWLGGGALVGGGIGVAMAPATPGPAVVSGAMSGVALVATGGIVTAIFSKPNRSAGLAAAGIGFGGIMLLSMVGAAVAVKQV